MNPLAQEVTLSLGGHLFQHGGDPQRSVQPWHAIREHPGHRLWCGEGSWKTELAEFEQTGSQLFSPALSLLCHSCPPQPTQGRGPTVGGGGAGQGRLEPEPEPSMLSKAP